MVLLDNDILSCEAELLKEHLPVVYAGLNDTRKAVLVNMCFNLGISGLLGFKNTLAFIGAGDFERAANNMLASKWAKQVGLRAIELSEQMRKSYCLLLILFWCRMCYPCLICLLTWKPIASSRSMLP